jgi:hypothetical protein
MRAKIFSFGSKLNLTLLENGLTPMFSSKLCKNGYGIDYFFLLLKELLSSFKD